MLLIFDEADITTVVENFCGKGSNDEECAVADPRSGMINIFG